MNEDLIVQYFKSMESRFDRVDTTLNNLTTKVSTLEAHKIAADVEEKTTDKFNMRLITGVSILVSTIWALFSNFIISHIGLGDK